MIGRYNLMRRSMVWDRIPGQTAAFATSALNPLRILQQVLVLGLNGCPFSAAEDIEGIATVLANTMQLLRIVPLQVSHTPLSNLGSQSKRDLNREHPGTVVGYRRHGKATLK